MDNTSVQEFLTDFVDGGLLNKAWAHHMLTLVTIHSDDIAQTLTDGISTVLGNPMWFDELNSGE